MKENEIDDLKKMEKNNTYSMDEKNEKVHYEIKFVETEDGYRLEASGDKQALKRLGIGPNMVGKGRGRGRGHEKDPHGHRGRWNRGPRWAHRGPDMRGGRGRAAAMARRQRRMNRRWQFAGYDQPGHPTFACRPPRRFHGSRQPRHGAGGFGQHPGKGRPDFWNKGYEDTWDW